jgi:hypothetical protein
VAALVALLIPRLALVVEIQYLALLLLMVAAGAVLMQVVVLVLLVEVAAAEEIVLALGVQEIHLLHLHHKVIMAAQVVLVALEQRMLLPVVEVLLL